MRKEKKRKEKEGCSYTIPTLLLRRSTFVNCKLLTVAIPSKLGQGEGPRGGKGATPPECIVVSWQVGGKGASAVPANPCTYIHYMGQIAKEAKGDT